MVLPWLIQEWIARWLGLRDRLRDRADPDTWWLGIRERILRFLVSRYVEEERRVEADITDPLKPPPLPLEYRRTCCRAEPEDHPPRRCADMADKLHSVSRINETKHPRWRWL